MAAFNSKGGPDTYSTCFTEPSLAMMQLSTTVPLMCATLAWRIVRRDLMD